MSDSADNLGYAAAFDTYWQAGWRGILPLRDRSKWPPPPFQKPRDGEPKTSYTGYSGVDPSYGDILAWAEDFRDGNLALRLPDGIVGIDVDGYGAKTGAQTFAEAIKRWGPLPPAPRSSSRQDDLVSGIRLFRVQPGTSLQTKIDFPELGIGDVEIIQRHHRYVVAWPSIHPEGRGYWWVNDEGQLLGVPEPDSLPWLPDTWVAGLRVQPRSQIETTDYNVRLALTEGESSMRVQSRLRDAIRELNMPGSSRHDTALRHVMALLRMGKTGEAGVKAALQLLCDVFIAAVTVDGSRNPDIARSEFIRMIDNDNAAKELSQPSVTDWFNAMVVDTAQISPETPGNGTKTAENTPDSPENDDTPTGGKVGVSADAATGVDNAAEPSTAASTASTGSPLAAIEQGFWESRESLAKVWQTSMAMMASPWGVLAHCAARALTQVRPCVTLPALIGGPGSLNWFALVAAAPSLGKGTAARTAKLLVPDPIVEWEVGSGEGMIAVYGRKADDRIEAIMFKAEEMDSINALNSRSGSTTLSILRSGFFAEQLGSAYSDEKKCRRLEDGAYRMTLIVSTQPERAAWLLADAGGGTPQRFMWFPGSDPRLITEETWPATRLDLPHPSEWQYPREIVIPTEVRQFLRTNHAKNSRGEVDGLNGHALFSREKFAFALTVLDGRTEMTMEDWELSGIAAEVSAHTRDAIIDEIEAAAREDASERGRLRGIEMAAATTMKAFEDMQQWPRVVRWVRDRLGTAGEAGVTTRELSRTAPKSIRDYIPSALAQLAKDGLATNVEKTRWIQL